MAYAGYLLKVKSGNSYTVVPTQYIEGKTYSVTPNQRMEWSAERDVTGVLKRETVANMPPKIEFQTIQRLTNTQVSALNTIFSNAYTDAAQRRLTIQYYDPETDTYKDADCYMPDVEYKISEIDSTKVYYEQLRYAFIGY